MMLEVDIWITDNAGNKIHVENETVRSLEDATYLLAIAWQGMSDMRNKATREDGSHSGT